MVFTAIKLFIRNRGPDEFWRKRQIFKLAALSGVSRVHEEMFSQRFASITAGFFRGRFPHEHGLHPKASTVRTHYIGRRRNCYSLAIRGVHRALVNATYARKLKKEDMKQLWETRIDAAAQEHGINLKTLLEGLSRCNILLNRKSLEVLAAWEPRTFKSLSDVACAKAKLGRIKEVAHTPMPKNVIFKDLVDK